MSSIADSEAQFTQRLKECNVPDHLAVSLAAEGIKTIATLAYSFGQPGQTIDDTRFTTWVRSIAPAASVGAVGALKRLLFESQTQLLALLKEQVTQSDSVVPKKIPQAEREVRMRNLKTKLTGQVIEGVTEPGHCLLEQAMHMHERNQITYIGPEKCVSRLHELTASKHPERLVEVESSKLIIKEKSESLEIVAQTALQVQEALRRRGLALEFAGVMNFSQHERYLQLLFAHLHRDPPANYNRCTVSQLVNADKECWKRVIQDNVKPRMEAGAFPLNDALIEALKTYEVSFTLMPLPSIKQTKPEARSDVPAKSLGKPAPNRFNRPFNKFGKSKGKGKSKWEPRIPQKIREAGGKASTPAGEPVCFSYNLHACAAAADGARCEKGHHVCAKCFGPHSLKDHGKH